MVGLKGYTALQREFRVQEVMLGDINLLPYSLFADLRAVRPRLVDAARWFDPIEKGRPRYSWSDFLTVHGDVEQVASRHTWLADWKQAGAGRTIESHIFGIRPWEELDLAHLVTPAWKHAGLKGTPGLELLLRRGDRTWAELYLSKDDPAGLIVSAKPTTAENPSHWLDRLTISYHPTQTVPDYVIVTPKGTPTRNQRPK